MPAQAKSRPHRRNPALSHSLTHAPFSNNTANPTGLYGGLQKDLDVIQRLKLLCIAREMQSSDDLHLEFVATYKTAYRSPRQNLDHLDPGAAGGLAPLIAKLEIHRVCGDGATFINKWFLPFVRSPDDRVFLCKSVADFRRYICMACGMATIEARIHSCLALGDYTSAFAVASEWLNPANTNRLGLTLNFALFYREALGRDQHACHLAKFGFDKAVRFISVHPEHEVPENAFLALSILKGHLISWTSRP